MSSFARNASIVALAATVLGLALAPIDPADAADPPVHSVGGWLDSIAELGSCVREVRTEVPSRPHAGAVARCLRPTRVHTVSRVRWSTCRSGGIPAPGERCETGSARIELRATDADREFRRGEGPLRWAQRWHLYGRGTAQCTREIHGLAADDPRAHRSATGQIEHVDFLTLWPSGSTTEPLAIGVHPTFSNWLKSTLPEDALDLRAAACRTLWTVLLYPIPPFATADVARLLAPGGATVQARARHAVRVPKDWASWARPVGGPVLFDVVARTTVTFAVSKW